MAEVIPLIDFSNLSIAKENINYQEDADGVGKELVKAFEEIGFVYLKNFGISENEVVSFNSVCASFFNLPLDNKQQLARPPNGNHGYVCSGLEALEPGRPPDLRECFNYTPVSEKVMWPDDAIAPYFKQSMESMFSKCNQLSNRVLQVLASGLKYEDIDYFVKSHRYIGKPGNCTTLRSLYYPPISDDVIPNQIRCGEHSDYGSVTLLFQDDAGGLQVKGRDGSYIEAHPIKGTVLINIGDLLMRWSSDRFISTRHRVLLPDTDAARKTVRQSFAFFVHPDDDYMISCLDGSNKYPPISSLDYLNMKFKDSYGDTK